MAASTAPVTAEQLLTIREDDARCDLIRGELVWTEFMWMSEATASTNLLISIAQHVEALDLGEVLGNCGFILERDPDTVLGPDVAFVRAVRLPPRPFGDEYLPGPPDLAAEVICHADPAAYVADKVALYLAAGTQVLWMPEPRRGLVLEYKADGRFAVLRDGDVLDGEDILPGFALPVADVFR